jgi:hypothetical protein
MFFWDGCLLATSPWVNVSINVPYRYAVTQRCDWHCGSHPSTSTSTTTSSPTASSRLEHRVSVREWYWVCTLNSFWSYVLLMNLYTRRSFPGLSSKIAQTSPWVHTSDKMDAVRRSPWYVIVSEWHTVWYDIYVRGRLSEWKSLWYEVYCMGLLPSGSLP